jgi:hypothetical protein
VADQKALVHLLQRQQQPARQVGIAWIRGIDNDREVEVLGCVKALREPRFGRHLVGRHRVSADDEDVLAEIIDLVQCPKDLTGRLIDRWQVEHAHDRRERPDAPFDCFESLLEILLGLLKVLGDRLGLRRLGAHRRGLFDSGVRHVLVEVLLALDDAPVHPAGKLGEASRDLLPGLVELKEVLELPTLFCIEGH